MQVFLIRHPRPQVDDGVCYGRLDVPACDVAAAAESLRPALPAGLPVLSSPLRRCRELAERLHPAPRFDDGLMEMYFGDWEGRRWDEIGAAALDAWAADLLHHVPPGGESVAMLQARVVATLDALVAEGLSACIVVTHTGVIRAAVGHARRLTVAEWASWRVDYACCLPLDWPPAGTVQR